ncbi:MAG: hypothetical protein QHH14_10455 [Clostridiales bacterium]|nr:hypothetical protein [Clostridiales bacterium]
MASISPVAQPLKARNLGELKSLLAAIPRLGPEAEAFESDIKAARESQPVLPKGS